MEPTTAPAIVPPSTPLDLLVPFAFDALELLFPAPALVEALPSVVVISITELEDPFGDDVTVVTIVVSPLPFLEEDPLEDSSEEVRLELTPLLDDASEDRDDEELEDEGDEDADDDRALEELDDEDEDADDEDSEDDEDDDEEEEDDEDDLEEEDDDDEEDDFEDEDEDDEDIVEPSTSPLTYTCK